METAFVTFLILVSIACVIVLFRIEDAPRPQGQPKPREGQTAAMPAQVRPSPPPRRR